MVFEFGTLNGGERSMLAVLPQFVGSDLEFVALAPAVGPLSAELGAMGIPVLSFAAREDDGERRSPPTLLGEIRSAAARVKPDLVHGNSLSMGRLTGQLAPDLGVPTTAHLRDIISLSRRAVEQLNGNRALVAVSKAVRDFHQSQGLDPARTHVVYSGVETSRFVHNAADPSLRDELRLPSDAYLVATIGQICLRKGQDVFAKAAALAGPRLPKAHFLLIGERYSEKTESALYDEALNFEFAMAGLSTAFTGSDTDPTSSACCPSWTSSSIARGRSRSVVCCSSRPRPAAPIITTRVGGTEEMLIDGESAVLVAADEPQQLADEIVRLSNDVTGCAATRRRGASARHGTVFARAVRAAG